MITFVMIMIGRCCSGAVLRRSWLGLGGITLVAAAGLAAYGIMGALSESIQFELMFQDIRAWSHHLIQHVENR